MLIFLFFGYFAQFLCFDLVDILMLLVNFLCLFNCFYMGRMI